MSHADFVHLRVHSAYSLAEGAIKGKELVSLATKNAMPAVAMTDSGNLFGALEFAVTASGAGVQPIIGAQLAIRRPDTEPRSGLKVVGGTAHMPNQTDQIVLIAQTDAGYRNLMDLISRSFTKTDPGESPQIPFDDLEGRSDGLIALTGGPEGKIGRLLLDNRAEEAETALRSKSDKLSEIRAHKSSTQRSLDDAKARLEKLNRQLDDVADEATKIVKALSEDKTLQARQEALVAARSEAERAEQDADKAEAATRQAEQELSEARPALTSTEAEITKLDAEAQAIGKMLELHDQSLWPAIVDALEVEPGFETALGAAIGDDLDASSDDAAPLFWSQPGDHSNDAPLPAGADALSGFVKGPALLTRRLNQIGVVALADGERLMRELKPGQTLVTKDGDLWRWDGFVARGDAPTAAAQRLAQRNRLADIDAERRAFASKQESIRADVQAKSEKLAASREQERQ